MNRIFSKGRLIFIVIASLVIAAAAWTFLGNNQQEQSTPLPPSNGKNWTLYEREDWKLGLFYPEDWVVFQEFSNSTDFASDLDYEFTDNTINYIVTLELLEIEVGSAQAAALAYEADDIKDAKVDGIDAVEAVLYGENNLFIHLDGSSYLLSPAPNLTLDSLDKISKLMRGVAGTLHTL